MSCPWEVYREAEREKIRLALATIDEIKRVARRKTGVETRKNLLAFISTKDFEELCEMAILDVFEESLALWQLLRRDDLTYRRSGLGVK